MPLVRTQACLRGSGRRFPILVISSRRRCPSVRLLTAWWCCGLALASAKQAGTARAGEASFLPSSHRIFSSLHPACLSSASLSFWLRVGEGGAAVTRSFLDSLTFGGVPLFGHPTITHTPYYHSSFFAQHRIITSSGTSRTSRCSPSETPTPAGVPAGHQTCPLCLEPPTEPTAELTSRTSWHRLLASCPCCVRPRRWATSLASLEISLAWATYLELRSAEEQAAGSPRPPPCPAPRAARVDTTDSGLRPLQHLGAPPCESRQVLSTLLTRSHPR